MPRTKSFLSQLDNFRHEAYVAAQYVYSEAAVQHAASRSERLLFRLNETPTFWLAHSAATQSAAYLCIARVFDRSSPYNVDALLNSFEADLPEFSREALSKRKSDGGDREPEWLQDYLNAAYYPGVKDVSRLRAQVLKYRVVYQRVIEPARHRYIAHRVKINSNEVEALFATGKVQELWRMVTFLYALYEALWGQYHNGRKAVLRPRRYSIKTIFDRPVDGGAPHERIVSETKKLMQMLERGDA